MDGARKFTFDIPANFDSYFSEETPSLDLKESFILKMADDAVGSEIVRLIDVVQEFVESTGLTQATNSERDRIAKHFTALSPAPDPGSLAEIINAGWYVWLDFGVWRDFEFTQTESITVLNDLVFKTIEVLEYRRRVN